MSAPLTKDKVLFGLFFFVTVTTSIALIASMAHMLTAFTWANVAWMSWGLAFVIVMQNVAFIALATLNPDPKVRRAVYVGMTLLFLVEFTGNYFSGGLIAMKELPPQIGRLFFNLERDILVPLLTFVFAAFLPLINFLAVYALSEAALGIVEKVGQPAQANQWASLMLQMQERVQQPQAEHDDDVSK